MAIYDDGRWMKRVTLNIWIRLKEIINAYSEGKLNEKHYESLKDQISVSYEEIFSKRIGLLEPSDKDIKAKIKELENDIVDAYSKGKISEVHYNLTKREKPKPPIKMK